MPQTFLHIGCGPKRKDQTLQGFNSEAWTELRFDIDESVKPDLVGICPDLQSAGFRRVASRTRPAAFDLWAIASNCWANLLQNKLVQNTPLKVQETCRALAEKNGAPVRPRGWC